jgi:hypothetical protein
MPSPGKGSGSGTAGRRDLAVADREHLQRRVKEDSGSAEQVPGEAGAAAPDASLQQVTQVAVIRHARWGVLLLHSRRRRWHFPDASVLVYEQWDESLRRGVTSATGITDLEIRSVLRIQNFAPGTVHPVAQYGVFLLCTTPTDSVQLGPLDDAYRWVTSHDDLTGIELFHPVVEELVLQALEERPEAEGHGLPPGQPAWSGRADGQRRGEGR